MANELTIKIAGEAGQGMQTIGMALCRIYKLAGYSLFANQDYMSRIRGGNNFFQLRISDHPLYTLREKCDITVALDKESVAIHRNGVSSRGIIVLDRKKFNIHEDDDIFFDVPAYAMAKETGGDEIFVNSVSCGVLAGLTGVEFQYVDKSLKVIFEDKKEEVITKNLEAARAGYEFTLQNFSQDVYRINRGKSRESILMNGNKGVAMGALVAGCRFYSGYPMTPSTSIMNDMARYAKDFNIIVEQAEDEIAAVNMVIGASFAGVRSMTGTSGGGFALMVEGLSLAGMTETPVVIVVAQRPAPATGFPTRTEQADMEFLLHAGHGEFARAIFSPGTIEEAFYLTIRAFDIAEKFQIPVLIMTDQHLADSFRDVETFDLDKIKVQRYIIPKEESVKIKNYKRYQFTESGVSPRAVPSWIEDVIYADSDEHTEEGHITEDAGIRRKMVEKRFYKKMERLSREVERPKTIDTGGADVILAGFGSTYGVLKEVKDSLETKKVGLIHLSQVWPFPVTEVSELLKGRRKCITVENNAGAQLARLIKRETGISVDKSILKFDGRPFNLDFLLQQIGQEV